MTRAALILSALALASCATTRAPPPIIVKVPVPVPCVSKDFPPRPTYTDTLAALQGAADQGEFTRLLAGNWPVRDARLVALEAAVEVCRASPPSP